MAALTSPSGRGRAQQIADGAIAPTARRRTPRTHGRSDTGKKSGSSSLSIDGIASREAASRTHIAVFESTGPSDRYSAMPSMNHSGRACRPFPGDVVLERVHQLVAEHVIGFGQSAGKRQNDAAAIAFRHAAGPFADLAEDVRLLKMRMAA